MSDIDEVKARTNIIDVISARVTLKKAGRHWKALCPFHSEKTPSFIVSPERQIWKCFGCGKGGSVIDFVMEYEHVDFIEALEELADKAGVKLERIFTDTPEAKLKQKLYEVNHLASEFYHFLLTKHALGERARVYLKGRAISDKSMKTFMLGYSPNSWDGLLKYLTKKGYDGETLEKAGLVIKSQNSMTKSQQGRYYDRFRGRVMFTLKDHRSNVVGFSGRLLDPDAKAPPSLKVSTFVKTTVDRSEGQGPKYINTSETPVYSKSNVLYGFDVTKKAIQDANEAIIMEGELDVISSYQAGIPNIVAIKGSALTEGHALLLRRFTERIVFALDSDIAGDAASRRGIEIADHVGLDMRVLVLDAGKDPDEAVRKAPERFKKSIKKALPVYEYFILSAMNRFDATTSYGKRKVSEELFPVLAAIDNTIVQGHYVAKVAEALGVSLETVMEGLKKHMRDLYKPLRQADQSKGTTEPSNLTEKLERYLLSLLLQGRTVDLYEELVSDVPVADFSLAPIRNILERLGEYLGGHRVFLIKDFVDALPKELIPTLDESFLWDTTDILGDEEHFAKEWNKIIRTLRFMILRRKIQETTNAIAKTGTAKKQDSTPQDRLRALTEELKTIEKSG